jgi:conjugative transfer pilus assembly protein TraH
VFFAATPARADLNDALDQMFQVTGTEAQRYESQRRLGMDLGTLRLRAPINEVSLINLTPPEIRGGCGGIDLYGGSFSFINTEQFRQVLRQIGANAVGYAFQLALKTMCDACNQIITGLQDMMNSFTRMNVNTCQWGQGIVNDTIDAMGLAKEVEGMTKASAQSEAQGMIDAAVEAFAVPGRWLARGDASGADPTNPKVGNVTFNAVKLADASARVTFAAGQLNTEELLMNIAGTMIFRAPTAAETAAGIKGTVAQEISPTITYADFKSGKQRSAATNDDITNVLKCGNAQCLTLTPLDQWDFPGVEEWVTQRLIDVQSHYSNPMTAGQSLPLADQQFLGASPLPITMHMVELQGSPGMANYLAIAATYLADAYAAELAISLADVVTKAYEDPRVNHMSPKVGVALDAFRTAAMDDRERVRTDYVRVLNELEALVRGDVGRERNRPAQIGSSRSP